MFRFVTAVVLASVVQFVWGMVFWMVLPVMDHMYVKVPTASQAALESAVAGLPESGVYILPYPDEEVTSGKNEEAANAFMERHKAGPLVQVTLTKTGVDCMDPTVFAFGFGHIVVSTLLAGVLMLMALPNLESFAARAAFVSLLGLFATFAVGLSGPVWMHHPWKNPLIMAGFEWAGWVMAAVVMGMIVKPAK